MFPADYGEEQMVNANTLEKLTTILRPITDEQEANTAVALILKSAGDDFEVLLVRRIQNPKDPWSGQMALPGGKREPKDVDLRATAVRETLEETCIDLQNSRFLGVTSAFQTDPRPNLRILPFITNLNREQNIKLCTSELEMSIWVPVEKIAQSRGTTQISRGEVPAFILENAVVWGITYRILNDFLNAINQANNQ
jgi:8-oxo-dGTP diphosphatase